MLVALLLFRTVKDNRRCAVTLEDLHASCVGTCACGLWRIPYGAAEELGLHTILSEVEPCHH